MEFQVLSHAGLAVRAQGKELLVDPWVVGSTYWRSWWNYPPVAPALVAGLRPDAIYLTHVHWDHFQGVSLRRFPRGTTVFVPRYGSERMRRDLEKMGFTDVRELRHGERAEIAPGFAITSYHFGVFVDSALVVEADGTTLLDANDAKLMGGPLRHLLRRHGPIDFVLRSHSSANSRLCYEWIDAPAEPVDDEDRYVRGFERFTVRCGARYAVPFASNHCHLHKDTWRFNALVTTPRRVADHFRARGISSPEVAVMVSGDSWSREAGFRLADDDWFEHREERLEAYRRERSPTLERSYAREAAARVDLAVLRAYFARLSAAMPFWLRRRFRGRPVAYALTAGPRVDAFLVDVHRGRVEAIDRVTDDLHPLQVHTSAHVLRRCLESDLFSHLPISKRVRYRVRFSERRRMRLLNLVFNAYEYDLLPLRRWLSPRNVSSFLDRWREGLLYAGILLRSALRGRLTLPDD